MDLKQELDCCLVLFCLLTWSNTESFKLVGRLMSLLGQILALSVSNTVMYFKLVSPNEVGRS